MSGWTLTSLASARNKFLNSAMSFDVRDENGDPWSITGVWTDQMYDNSCVEDVANSVRPSSSDWSCLPPAAPAPAADSASGAAPRGAARLNARRWAGKGCSHGGAVFSNHKNAN